MKSIDASELRLGNWVQDEDESNLQFQVTKIETGIGIVSDFIFIDGRSDHGIIPIPLTEEWLIKLGFVKVPNNGFVNGIYGIRLIPNTGENPNIWQFGIACSDLADIQFVHQLQNLTHDLTGTELIVK